METLSMAKAQAYIAERTGVKVGRTTLLNWVYAGKIPYIRVGWRLFVRRADLDAFIEFGGGQKEKGGQV